jgi:3-hydroxymyristoyl/3-hydroxydecanoyl-(acyl carrier protein) dehydratase
VWRETAEAVPVDHPCLPGHFPGNPIVPGTLIIDRVVALLIQHHPEARVAEIISAKFLRPLLPGQVFEVCAEEKSGQISFECQIEQSTIATGKVALIDDR